MSKFIEEFYCGNIDPQARSTKKNKTVQKEMAVLKKTEKLLTNSLRNEQKNRCIYVNSQSKFHSGKEVEFSARN